MTAQAPRGSILVVDDESEIVTLLAFHLEAAGFDVLAAFDGLQGLEMARRPGVSLVVLDIMLPGISGLEVLNRLRGASDTRDIPVILLTALREDTDRIRGLTVGADDYLTKPFNPDELVLRAQAILRRIPPVRGKGDFMSFGRLSVHTREPRVRVDSTSTDLTVIEYRLMRLLADNPGEIHSREHLLGAVWGASPDMRTRTLDVHINRLRSKLGPAGDMIETVRGFGYRLKQEASITP